MALFISAGTSAVRCSDAQTSLRHAHHVERRFMQHERMMPEPRACNIAVVQQLQHGLRMQADSDCAGAALYFQWPCCCR